MAFGEIDGEKRFNGQSPLPLARDLRQTAWDALCERYQFWRFLGGFLTLTIAVAVIIVFGGVVVELLSKLCGSPSGYSNFKDMINDPFFWRAIVPIAILSAAALTYVIGFMTWGIAKMSVNTIRRTLKYGDCFSGWGYGWHMVWVLCVSCTRLFLWSLLFIVPGIIKSLSYALTDILAVDHPDWTPDECIDESSRLMYGHRWRFVRLNLSFIGWFILAGILRMIPGIGFIVQYGLQIYTSAAKAAFYEDLIARDSHPAAVSAEPGV